MIVFLTLVSGIAWTVAYIESIRVGFRDRTYATPVAALALNIAWESIHAGHALLTGLSTQGIVNAVWTLADVVIVYTFITFGRRELPDFVTRAAFAAWTVLIFATAYLVQSSFVAEFGWVMGARYSAFLQNLLMSGLFISMFVARRGARGQSLVIAIAKWLGTLAPTILFGVIYANRFLLGLGILCSVFDLVYAGLLLWNKRRPPSRWLAPG